MIKDRRNFLLSLSYWPVYIDEYQALKLRLLFKRRVKLPSDSEHPSIALEISRSGLCFDRKLLLGLNICRREFTMAR